MENQAFGESGSTRAELMRFLLEAEEPCSVTELAGRLGISRNAAHQHIVSLERDGLIEKGEDIRTRGRPSQRYRLSEYGRSSFPRQYALLTTRLVSAIAGRLDETTLASMLKGIGRELAHELAADGIPPAGIPIREVVRLMQQLGYEARKGEGGGEEIEAHNCVYHEAAQANPAVCEMDITLLETLTRRSVRHSACMAKGDCSCRFSFAEKGPGTD
ncbi:helix-turn-helix transcriptional regulator [Aurantiacibacter sp. D1-12]|uniref:helix-turn-helix transcriptional regulator n=1 Tax=Aurantiacibacter sp. D1-12 TaxID=2993658 RepID=UPI00237C8B5C|nr:helix-turn-helix domain-containing protein [Aurantiacibacter sp. D1-12]MDE1468161.1 helix-turn-helix domain-containing protein [Aurantiacibacter sp. D1-12]